MSDTEFDFWNKAIFDGLVRDGKIRKNSKGVYEFWRYIVPDSEEDEPYWENTHRVYKPKSKTQMLKWYNSMVEADSNKYKALGNSIALPQWWWLFCKMKPYLPENPTIGSLFDGIGGFPLCFEKLFGKGSARWASEIEPFPIAVTKYHFQEEQ